MRRAARPWVALLAVVVVLGATWWSARPVAPNGVPVPVVPSSASSAPTVTARPGKPRTAPVVIPADQSTDPMSGLPWVAQADLPPEASTVLAAIKRGGPFAYDKDGATFFNLEGLLPRRGRGYYREFTVRTPGERDRGPRRIVTGGPRFGVAKQEFYYTGDHYQSFERIRP